MSHRSQIYVIEDDAAVNASLCWLMESADYEVHAFASADAFLRIVPSADTGCVITDVRMPGTSGIDLLRVLGQRGYPLPIIVITGQGDIQMAVEAMKLGAFDFIEKPFNDEALLDIAERALLASSEWGAIGAAEQAIRDRYGELTPREREVLALLVTGRSNRLVAELLGISEKTVEAHRAHVMEKMAADSFADLVTMAVRLDFASRGSE